MKAMIVHTQALLTKQLTLNDNCILCSLFELNDIVKNLNPDSKCEIIIGQCSSTCLVRCKLFAWTAAGRRVRIMRTNMTTLTQIWITLLLSNILPSDHNSDLPLPKCQLVYVIMT